MRNLEHRSGSRRGLVAAGMFALSLAASAWAQEGRPATPVRVDAARREMLQERRMVTGDLHALRRSRVATREGAVVLQRLVREGQRVEAGAVLAQLDGARLEIALRQIDADREVAEAILEERTAEVDQRERDADLLKSSFERGAANSRELNDAQSALRVARARADQTRRQLGVIETRGELLRTRVEDMKICAPFEGVVVTVEVEQGEWVGEGETIAELVSTGAIEAWLNVPQRYLAAATAEHAAVAVKVEATEQMLETTQLRVIPLVDPRARTFTLVGRLENPDDALSTGMSVTAWVPTEREMEQVTVSKDALLRNDAGAFVYVAEAMSPDGPAMARPVSVQVLFPVGDRVVVQAPGLADGAQVVVEGNERLFPMMPVRPIEASTPVAQRSEGVSR